ncbi:NAD(P)/FAD-dependent oxidoreductase [Catenuloplanes indicus]|nr:FAD-dependent oxidoreductase [Catenuloplanes indicus]
MDYRDVSFWMATSGDDLTPRPALPGDRDVDVAIVGAGYTGLWTAYYLAAADPSLRIAVLEKDIAGYGASGRNGGWCSSLFSLTPAGVARRHGQDGADALQRALEATVDEVGRVIGVEGIDCHWTKGGSVTLARTPAQLARARAAAGPGSGLQLLDAGEASARCGASGVLGGVWTPHCAVVQPARLVRGLARAVERRGVTIYERTPVTSLPPGAAVTPHGRVRADVVVRATEGYTAALPGGRRALVPLHSLMFVTEPLPASFWARAGLAGRETFTDFRHMVIYGQRTADDRLAFGGRGAPYRFGSTVPPAFDRDPRVLAAHRAALVDLFPTLPDDVRISHVWGGPMGIPADWHASVGRDGAFAWAGGYVGDGVGASNLAGRTLADLIRGESTDLTRLPWVGHRSPRWVPEPLRWLGITAGLGLIGRLDAAEARSGRTSRGAAILGRLLGE